MVTYLGRDSPWAREINGPWTQSDALLWDVGNQIRLLRRDLYNVFLGKQVDIEPFPRPEPTDAQRERAEQDAPEEDLEVREDLLRALNGPRQMPTTT